MPTYRKLTIAQLCEICDERGISHENCKYKRELINAIEQNDLHSENVLEDGNSDDSEIDDVEQEEPLERGSEYDDEVQLGHNDDVIIDDTDTRGASAESETVTELRLRLALAREQRAMQEQAWQIEQHRAEMRNSGSLYNCNTLNMELKDIKSLLPTLCDTDVLSFFLTYERVLTINGVDTALWCRLLPGQLSPKVLKTFSRLSLEETQDYQKKSRTLSSRHINLMPQVTSVRFEA